MVIELPSVNVFSHNQPNDKFFPGYIQFRSIDMPRFRASMRMGSGGNRHRTLKHSGYCGDSLYLPGATPVRQRLTNSAFAYPYL